jgi:hypothetical protein
MLDARKHDPRSVEAADERDYQRFSRATWIGGVLGAVCMLALVALHARFPI